MKMEPPSFQANQGNTGSNFNAEEQIYYLPLLDLVIEMEYLLALLAAHLSIAGVNYLSTASVNRPSTVVAK